MNEQAIRTAPAWVDTSNRLPKKGLKVCTKVDFGTETRLFINHRMKHTGDWFDYNGKVTQWLEELPAQDSKLKEQQPEGEARVLDRQEYAKWIRKTIQDELTDGSHDSLAERLAFEFDAHVSAVYEGGDQWKADFENLKAMMSHTKPWPVGGYAPGNYYNHCIHCKKEFRGDKMACSCLECALSGMHTYVESLQAEIQKLREERDGWEETAQRFINQNCSLLDERDRSNASFKRMSDLFDLKIEEANDYRAVLQEVWDNRNSTLLLDSFKRVIKILKKYLPIPTTKE